MKVLFMAKETVSSLAAIKYLLGKKFCIAYAVIRPSDQNLSELCRINNIPFGSEEELLSCAAYKTDIDYLFSFYWKLAKAPTLKIAKYGSINFHPGPLPEARGSGYHAAILENWGYWGVTAHYMDETFDTGDIIECRKFPISENIVNCDLVQITHIELSKLFIDIADKIIAGELPTGIRQAEGIYYSKQAVEKEKEILPTDTAEKIARKIRAFWHPPYSGAQISIGEKKYTVIDENILRYIYDHTLPRKECDTII